MRVKHKLTTPFWPRTNGEVERQNRSLLKAMRAAHAEKKNWQTELNKYLLAYRSTAHTTTSKSPAEMLYGRKISSKLPDIGELGEVDDSASLKQTRDRDTEKKQVAADYADKRRQASEKELETGDLVLLEKKKENKFSPAYESEPYKITACYGDQIHIKSPQGVTYKRNIQHLKKYHSTGLDENHTPEASAEGSHENQSVPMDMPSGETTSSEELSSRSSRIPSCDVETTAPRRSSRVTKPPERVKDHEHSFVLLQNR